MNIYTKVVILLSKIAKGGSFEPRRSRQFALATSRDNPGLSGTILLIFSHFPSIPPKTHFDKLGQSMTIWEHFL